MQKALLHELYQITYLFLHFIFSLRTTFDRYNGFDQLTTATSSVQDLILKSISIYTIRTFKQSQGSDWINVCSYCTRLREDDQHTLQ